MMRTIWWCDVIPTTNGSKKALPGAAVSVALTVAAAAAGCVDKGPHEKKIDPAFIKANILSSPPGAIQNRVDADLGGFVTYLGNDVDRKQVAPGTAATVVHYWKVVAPPGPEWRVFAHLVGADDHWMNLDRTDMRIGYPPGEWKAGDVIRDEQKFTLDGGWKSPYAQLTVGLYRKGAPEDRMPIESGPVDSESRVPVFRFSVERAGAAKRGSPPPQYLARRASGPIAIDGKADEKDWQAAAQSPAFVGAEGGPEARGSARARLLWDDAHLYAFIQVEDADVHSQYKAQDDPLWKEDVVELFIDADRNRRGYVELQVNPRNAHFDAWFPETRAKANHPEWNSTMKSAVVVRGTLDERGDQDEGWDAEIAIPLADVKGMDAAMKVATPPSPGDRWRLNVVRVDKPADGPLAASSWSAIPIADFHALSRMLTVVFADENGAVPTSRPAPSAIGKPAQGDAPGDAQPARAAPPSGAKPGAAGKAKPGATDATKAAEPKAAEPAEGTSGD
jgi:hypothetical protein